MSKGFWSDKRNVFISETTYYTWYQVGSLTKCVDLKKTGLLKIG